MGPYTCFAEQKYAAGPANEHFKFYVKNVKINIVPPSTTSVWQWQGDQGQWELYPPSTSAILDSAVTSGDATVTITLGAGTAYDVDLKKMLQINPATKFKRKIRCQIVKSGVCLSMTTPTCTCADLTANIQHLFSLIFLHGCLSLTTQSR